VANVNQELRPLVEKHLGQLKIPVLVYETYQLGVTAEEPTRA
jgi:hypothetical protein